MSRRFVGAVACALVGGVPAAAQEPVSVGGVVVEADGVTPVAAADVQLLGAGDAVLRSVATDSRGRWALTAPSPGEYRLRVQRLGYGSLGDVAVHLRAGENPAVTLPLRPEPVLLDTLLARVPARDRPPRAEEQLLGGRLLDDDTGEAIATGTIRLLDRGGDTVATTLSNDDGFFRLVSPGPGTYTLQAERIGYATGESPPLFLMLGDTIFLDFHLSVQAVLLAPITVTASARPWLDRGDIRGREPFYRRYAAYGGGMGHFLTRDSIAKWSEKTRWIGQMLTWAVPTVWGWDSRGGLELRRRCTPHVFLNGGWVPGEGAEDVVWSLALEDLEGVEVYASPAIPRELQYGRWPCGVVAFWTRR